jgi:hypothetical protein
LKTLDLLVNSRWDKQSQFTSGGKSSKFVVQPNSNNSEDRRVYIAAILLGIGAGHVALKVKVPIGRRESRLDLLAIFDERVLLVAYSSQSYAQKNAHQLHRQRQALMSTISTTDKPARGLLVIEGDLEFAGDLKPSLDGWAKAGTLSDLKYWTADDLFG